MKKSKWFGIVSELLLIIIALIFLYPLFNLLFASFKTPDKIFDVLRMPNSFYLENYKIVLNNSKFFISLSNTLLITVGSITAIVLVTSMSGYSIGRSQKGFFIIVFYIFLSGMIIPLQATIVPIFKIGMSLDMLNTRSFMVLLYTAGAVPFATMIYAGFVKSIPRELEEAASIDGCGPFRVFFTIVLPLLLPATGTVIVTNVFGIWNDFFGPLIYLQTPGKQTLMMMIYFFKQERTTDWGPVFALSILATVPLIILFLFVQKQFIKGLTAGALKG